MKVIAHICSEDVIRDVETNAVSLVNLLEEINAAGFPIFIPKLVVFLLLEKEGNEANVQNGNLKLKNNDKVLFSINVAFNFDGKTRTRNIIKINGLAMPTPGVFTTEFSIGTHLLSSQSVQCNLVPSSQVTQQTGPS